MRPVGWKQLLRSSETAVVCHRSCSNQWALWRRSGGDRRIRRTGTWRECCARDGTVGVAQYVIPTLQGTEGRVNARETGAGCNDWISWAIIILSGQSRQRGDTPWRKSRDLALLRSLLRFPGAAATGDQPHSPWFIAQTMTQRRSAKTNPSRVTISPV
jgi:hypothetical protein